MYYTKIAHTNIEPQNIVVHEKDGRVRFYFIEFETALHMKEVQSGEMPLSNSTGLGHVYTEGFVTNKDRASIKEAWLGKKWELYWTLQHKRDMYALGVVIKSLLDKHEKNSFPPNLLKVIERLQCVAEERLTANEALKQFEQALIEMAVAK